MLLPSLMTVVVIILVSLKSAGITNSPKVVALAREETSSFYSVNWLETVVVMFVMFFS